MNIIVEDNHFVVEDDHFVVEDDHFVVEDDHFVVEDDHFVGNDSKQLHNESLKENVDKVEVYDRWADTYEDYVNGLNYQGPINLAKEVFDYFHNSGQDNFKILDFGCGTGLVGLEISKLFCGKYIFNIDGIDISDKMIQHSRDKNIYRQLWQLDLFKDTLPQQYQYDLIVSSGVFLEGHVSFKMIDILLNSIKPFGVMFFTLRESFRDKNMEEYIKYVTNNIRIEILNEFNIQYLPDVNCKMVVLKKLF